MEHSHTPCPLYKKCSGCQLQNLPYEEQIHLKTARLIKLLGRFCHIEEIIGMDEPTHYRNKAQSAFCVKSGRMTSGIYQSTTRRIVEVPASMKQGCMLEDIRATRIVQTIRTMAPSFKLRAYDLATGRGFLRHVMIRTAHATGQIMVVLVTAPGGFPSCTSFVNELCRRHPEITTVVWNINPTDTPLFLGSESRVLYGEGTITDCLCGLSFRISPRSFYQINPVQTEILYRTAKELAGLTGKERLIDAYCGTGTIGLTMADLAREVIGVEQNRDAVQDAADNARQNGITNAKFYAGDAGAFMRELAARGESVDVVVTDPPRAGCSREFLQSLLTLSPSRVVYVSCNAQTLSRDLVTLTRGGYKVKQIQPVDLFPHTEHCEVVVLLCKDPGEHQMNLHAKPFELMKSGKKTIELRLWDEKRQRIRIGDKIVFTNTTSGQTLQATVLKLHRFDTFEELYQALPLQKCGYTADDLHTARASDMEAYYPADQQKKYGVVGLELSLLPISSKHSARSAEKRKTSPR
ncbi:MAG: 23S rRNA (uracil(1939)-C(5))-methyltransferase RlmD [Eubacteriales bacterium]